MTNSARDAQVFVEDDRVFFQTNNREFEVVVPETLRRYAGDAEAARSTADCLREALGAVQG